eukprot:gi/632974849/ref/XP_007903904.1/ PREDICTED: dynamin-binding protein [Callorhinchus milii]
MSGALLLSQRGFCTRLGMSGWECEGSDPPHGTDSLVRNTRYRRTAPGSLRRPVYIHPPRHYPDMTLLSAQASSLEATGLIPRENPEQKMLEKRAKVIEELLQTEADYIKDLEMCVSTVLTPLRESQVQKVDCESLFGNILTVIDLATRLLTSLEETDTIGPVFLRYRDELEEVYNVYCQNHEEAIALLEVYEREPEIQAQLSSCLQELRTIYRQWGKTNYINLGSFLIKPVQRVMRYPLLITELLGSTPASHSDHQPLALALSSLRELNVHINECKRRKDLVLKYRKGDEDSLMDKISKLSIHSIIKKSNRVSSHLKHLTGLTPQIKDEAFDEAEKQFGGLERLIKSFVRDVSLYLQHMRVTWRRGAGAQPGLGV